MEYRSWAGMFRSIILLQRVALDDAVVPWSTYLKVFVLLGVLVGLGFYALRYAARRSGGTGLRARGRVELIERLGLEPRRALYVIRAGSQYMAIGSSENGLQFLMELKGEELLSAGTGAGADAQ